MAVDHDYEKGINSSPIPDSPADEKSRSIHDENPHTAAERGHVATDR